MPSPFPGMDPYLEGSLWTAVHTHLAVEIVRQLMPKLRPRYLAITNERFVLDIPEGISVTRTWVAPDVSVAHRGGMGSGVTAVAEPPVRLTTVVPTPIPHLTVEIRDAAERRLVTAVELLSPTNKRGEGRQEYLLRRERLLRCGTHLVEIDLLRGGQRLPTLEELPPASYYVFVGRSHLCPTVDVWPIAISKSLPVVPIPLLPGDPDVSLDLQAAFTAAYEGGGYDLAVDYGRSPEVPLTPEQAAWSSELLHAVGVAPNED